MSYWLYQHLGNLAPAELREEQAAGAADEPRSGRGRRRRSCASSRGAPTASRRASAGASAATSARRGWSWSTRARGACSSPTSATCSTRTEWQWLDEQLTGDVDHLLIATSLPFLLGGGMHHLEAWNEAVAQGAWGKRMAQLGEKIRQDARPRALGGVPALVPAAGGDGHGGGERPPRAGAGVDRRSCRATCTTPTWRRSTCPATRPASSCRRCARRSATRSTRRSAG